MKNSVLIANIILCLMSSNSYSNQDYSKLYKKETGYENSKHKKGRLLIKSYNQSIRDSNRKRNNYGRNNTCRQTQRFY